MAGQLQFDFPNFELWHAGTACDHLGAIASQRFRFFVSRLNNLAKSAATFWSLHLKYARGFTVLKLAGLSMCSCTRIFLHAKDFDN
jgi:hypothetical protein